jgi:hypothetical protein
MRKCVLASQIGRRHLTVKTGAINADPEEEGINWRERKFVDQADTRSMKTGIVVRQGSQGSRQTFGGRRNWSQTGKYGNPTGILTRKWKYGDLARKKLGLPCRSNSTHKVWLLGPTS